MANSKAELLAVGLFFASFFMLYFVKTPDMRAAFWIIITCLNFGVTLAVCEKLVCPLNEKVLLLQGLLSNAVLFYCTTGETVEPENLQWYVVYLSSLYVSLLLLTRTALRQLPPTEAERVE